MILTDLILIPTTCPLNFTDKSSTTEYNIRDYIQKWCYGDKIRVQVRSDYYASGLTLKVYGNCGIYKDTASFDDFKELSDGYKYSDVEYTVDLENGYYYFCICDGDTWLAQSSWCYVGNNNNTFLLEYSNDENKIETIFKNTIYTATIVSQSVRQRMPRFYDVNNVDSGWNPYVSIWYDGGWKRFLVVGNDDFFNSYTMTYESDSGDIEVTSLEVASGVFHYAVELPAVFKTGTFKGYDGSTEIITSRELSLVSGSGTTAGTFNYYEGIYRYQDNVISFANTPYYSNAVFTETSFTTPLIYIYYYLGEMYVDIDLSNTVFYASNLDSFYVELYNEDDTLLETKNIDYTDEDFCHFDLDAGNYYIKAYCSLGDDDPSLIGQSVIFYTDGTAIFNVTEDDNSFFFRCEGGIKPNSDINKTNATDFSDQEDEVIPLHQNPYNTFLLTIGSNEGVPIWVRDKLNHIFSLNELRLNWIDVTKASEIKSFEAEPIEETGNKILKIELQNKVNDHLQTGVILLATGNELIEDTEFLTL
jgi:hypothetical protein